MQEECSRVFVYDDLVMRTMEDGDLERVRALRNSPSTWSVLTDVDLIDAEAQRQWFSRVRLASDRRYYVACDSQFDFIGILRMAEIDQRNRSVQVGADIIPELRGRGYGHKIYNLLKKYCFDFLNMHRIWLVVLDTNKVALHLYERQGFTIEGRFREAIFRDGAYHDHVVMSMLEHEYRGQVLT